MGLLVTIRYLLICADNNFSRLSLQKKLRWIFSVAKPMFPATVAAIGHGHHEFSDAGMIVTDDRFAQIWGAHCCGTENPGIA